MDTNQRAKRVVDLVAGQSREREPKGKQLSGKARFESLTPERRREIARKAAAARWSA